MPDVRDPAWQFIQTVVALAAIIITFVLRARDRTRKALSYKILSAEILDIQQWGRGKLKVVFKGISVRDVSRIVLMITNSGNVSILPDDFKIPLGFGFGEKIQLLAATVVGADPPALQESARVDIEQARAVFAPILLNAKDSITIEILVSEFGGHITPYGRIAGVKEIRGSAKDRVAILSLMAGVALTSLVIFVVIARGFVWPLFDGSYRSGFCWGLVAALVIGYTSRQLLYWWNRGLQFFSPTELKRIVVGALILVVLASVAKAISGGGG
jgi:hypothetical protein